MARALFRWSDKSYQVIKMLEEIGVPENVPNFVADVKAKKAPGSKAKTG